MDELVNGALTAMVNVARVGLGWELPVLVVFCCCLFVQKRKSGK